MLTEKIRPQYVVSDLEDLPKLVPNRGMAAYVVDEQEAYIYTGSGPIGGWEKLDAEKVEWDEL